MPSRNKKRRRELAGLLVLAALVIAPTTVLSWLAITSLSRAQAVFEKEIREAYARTADGIVAQGVSALGEKGRRAEERVRAFDSSPSAEERLVLADALPQLEGLIILDDRWRRRWPPQTATGGEEPLSLGLEEALREAAAREARGSPEEAAALYEAIIEELPEGETEARGRALSGLARCHGAAGRLEDTTAVLTELAAMAPCGGDLSLPLFARYRLWLIDFSPEAEGELLAACEANAYDAPAAQVRFYIKRLADYLELPVLEKVRRLLAARAADERLAEAALYLGKPRDSSRGALSPWGVIPFEGARYLYVRTAVDGGGEAPAVAVAFFDAQATAAVFGEDILASTRSDAAAEFRFVEVPSERAGGAKDEFIPAVGEAGEHLVLERRFPEPFDFWAVRVYSSGGGVEDLARSRVTFMSWAFVLTGLAVVLAVGAVFVWAKRRADLARLQTDFVANVTHELKTPLTGIRSLAETMQLERLTSPEKEGEFLAGIVRECERLTRLIGNVLDFSQLDRRKTLLRFERIDPAALVRDCVGDFKAAVNGDDLDLSLEAPEGGVFVLADSDTMKSVIFNLLDNAYKYSKPPRVIVVSVRPEGGSALVRVRDNGIGLTPAQAARIWRKFYRVDTSLSAESQGAGLGLPLVKAHVKAHGGSVSVESEPGNGSMFTVALPLATKENV